MAEKSDMNFFKKHFIRFVICSAFMGLCVVTTTHAARADVVQDFTTEVETAATAASSAATEASSAITAINTALLPYQNAWKADIDAVNNYLQTEIAGMNVDTASNNARTNENVRSAQDIALSHDLPAGYTWCGFAKATRAHDDLGDINHAVGQALANGGGGRPNDPATTAKDIRATMTDGLTACSGSQTESSAYKAINGGACPTAWGGRWERADLTSDVLFNHRQLPVPPASVWPKPKNGTYQPIPDVTKAGEKYMPFVASISHCQRKINRLPAAPQAVPGHVTVDVLAISRYDDMVSKATAAYNLCMQYVAERMQYGSGVDPAYASAQQDQQTGCTSDAAIGVIDTNNPAYPFDTNPPSTGYCQTDGRSALQAKYDWYNRLSAQKFPTVYLAGADAQTTISQNTLARSDAEDSTDKYVNQERDALNNAEKLSDDAVMVYTAAISQPITKQ